MCIYGCYLLGHSVNGYHKNNLNWYTKPLFLNVYRHIYMFLVQYIAEFLVKSAFLTRIVPVPVCTWKFPFVNLRGFSQKNRHATQSLSMQAFQILF